VNEEKCLPPLFGIPTSVKDYFSQKGTRATLGCTVRAHDIKDKDCRIIDTLRNGGLIPFVRTNVAQTTMTWETVNHLYGRSTNLWDSGRSVGGSSGGEGALLSAFCTPIGIGTDIGGSLRIPAEFNGITSLRSCFQRFSTSREYNTYPSCHLAIYPTSSSATIPLSQSMDRWPAASKTSPCG
jgi:amidase